MKKILLYQPFKPFFITGLMTLVIALFLYIKYPVSMFILNSTGLNINTENYKMWILISSFLFLLAGTYFIAEKIRLKTKSWLVILHYIFILLFVIFFGLFSLFGSSDVQQLVSKVPLLVLISLYGLIFVIDAGLFALGFLFFLINLASLRKN